MYINIHCICIGVVYWQYLLRGDLAESHCGIEYQRCFFGCFCTTITHSPMVDIATGVNILRTDREAAGGSRRVDGLLLSEALCYLHC